MFPTLIDLMGMFLFLLVAGAILRKKNWISETGKKTIADLIIHLVLPCNIINAFLLDMEEGFWDKFSQLLIIGIVVQVLSVLTAKFLFPRFSQAEKCVYQYGMVCPNSGFMGVPLAEGVFGPLGPLYTAVYAIPQRIAMWTFGVAFFTTGGSKKDAVKRVFTHPCMIAVCIGLVLMITQIELPNVLLKSITCCGNCCTALTMIYTGTILVDIDWRALFSWHQTYFAFIRLILLPAVIWGICLLFRVDPMVSGVSVLLTATAAGSTTSLLAAKYGADEQAAAKSIVFTTALSLITIPIWSWILLSML